MLVIFSDLSYEKAYCEYRLNKVKEARNTLKSCADQTTRVQELMAQIVSMISLVQSNLSLKHLYT